jgi:hypothetical protein
LQRPGLRDISTAFKNDPMLSTARERIRGGYVTAIDEELRDTRQSHLRWVVHSEPSPEAQNNAALAFGGAVSPPFEIAQIFVNSYIVECPPPRIRKVGNDESRMTLHRNHGVSLINAALPYAPAGMGVHGRSDAKIVFTAVFPQGCMANSVKRYRAPLVSVRIKVVITDEGPHVVRCRILRREQTRSALAAAPTPLFQLNDETTPQQDRNRYLLPGLIRGQGNLRN